MKTSTADLSGIAPPAGGSAVRVRLALSPAEAAEALGCSRDFFDEHVLPELRVVRRGRRIFVPIVELERWLAREAALLLSSQMAELRR